MTKHNESFISLPGNKKLYFQEWFPEKDVSSIILYVHGMGSHSSRMGHWAERFNKQGIAFLAYDHFGHGKSDGKRGLPADIKLLIEDLDSVVDDIKNRYPDKKLVIYGHSLGACIAINYTILYQQKTTALIATSPWLELTKPPAKGLVSMVKLLVRIMPGLAISNGLNAAEISHDTVEVEKYKKDPLVHDRISIGLFLSTHKAGLFAKDNAGSIKCPFLLMHGTGDRITSPKASEKCISQAGKNATLRLWDEAYHELHHEPERDAIFEYIMSWIKANKLS